MSGPSKKEKKQENKNIDFSAGHGTQEVNRTTLRIPHEALTLINISFCADVFSFA